MKAQLSEQFVHPLVVGALGYVGAYVMGEGNKVADIGSMSISLPLFLGISTGVSSAVGETFKQWVLPMVSGKYSSIESTLLGPALVGGVDGLALQFLTKSRLMEGFLLGAGSEILGSYAYDGFIKPYTMDGGKY